MLKLSDTELQDKILNYSLDAISSYFRASGAAQTGVPEHFIQDYCAIELIKAGFSVCVEVKGRDLLEWHFLPDAPLPLAADRVDMKADMLVYDPSPDGNADNAILRAVVEFKVPPDCIGDDLDRTRKLIQQLHTYPRHQRDGKAFGCIVTGGEKLKTFERVAGQIKTLHNTIAGKCPDLPRPYATKQLHVRESLESGTEYCSDVQMYVIKEAQHATP